LLHLKSISSKKSPYSQVNIPKLYKRVHEQSHGLNRLDGTITGLQYINWATLHVTIQSNIYI